MTRSFFCFWMISTTNLACAADWPQWMGPNRDDVWSETGIIAKFPDGGLKFRWRTPIHGGFSGPSVADGRVFVLDYVKLAGDAKPDPSKRNALQGRERVLCLDAKTGNEIWRYEFECNYSISYPAGPRCTPTVDSGNVFTLGAMGDEEISRTKLLDPVGVGLGRSIVWSHPAYADRCVFARNDQEIVCVRLAADE